jgi:hypothetical protein
MDLISSLLSFQSLVKQVTYTKETVIIAKEALVGEYKFMEKASSHTIMIYPFKIEVSPSKYLLVLTVSCTILSTEDACSLWDSLMRYLILCLMSGWIWESYVL